MDDTLRIIRYLYDEEEQPGEVERQLADDEELRAEYEELRAVKKQLDRRPRHRPDAEILDRITEAAGSARRKARAEDRSPRAVRHEREPVRSPSSRRQRIGTALAAALVMVVVAIGLWQYPSVLPGESSESAPLASEPSQAAQSATEQRATGERTGDLPAWDEAEDVVRLHRYIETLQSRSRPGNWDSGTLPLQAASQPTN